MEYLTEKQKLVLGALNAYQETYKIPPTIKEIMAVTQLPYTTTWYNISRLIDKEYVARVHKNRSLVVLKDAKGNPV